jgi:trigger factor
MSKMDMNNPSDYEFDFEIGLKPAFEIADISKATLTRNKVTVTDAMVNEEIDRMLLKAGKLVEAGAVDNDDNVITVLITGTDAENAFSKENSVMLKQFSADLQKELKGKKAGDTIDTTLAKAFSGETLDKMAEDLGLVKDDATATDQKVTLEIKKIEQLEKRELNEEFFNEVFPGKGITTEDALRTELQNEIQAYWDAQSRNQLHDQLYHLLLDETKMEFPENFLTRWLETGGDKPKTPEQAKEEFPSFKNQLKWTLISDRLITENKLEVTDEELKDTMKTEVMRYFGQMNMGEDMSWLDSYIDRMMKDEKQVDATYRRLITEKLFGHAESLAKPTEKTVTPEELTGMQHNHAH